MAGTTVAVGWDVRPEDPATHRACAQSYPECESNYDPSTSCKPGVNETPLEAPLSTSRACRYTETPHQIGSHGRGSDRARPLPGSDRTNTSAGTTSTCPP